MTSVLTSGRSFDFGRHFPVSGLSMETHATLSMFGVITDVDAAPSVADFAAVPGTALLLHGPRRRLQPPAPRPSHLPDDRHHHPGHRRDVPRPSPPPPTADRLRLQAVQDTMNARTPSASSPAAPGASSRAARPSSPADGGVSRPLSPMATPTDLSSSVGLLSGGGGDHNRTYSKMAFCKASQVAGNDAAARNSSRPTLCQNATPWKKRSLIRPASINFHSIEDLVRPGGSNRSHSPGGGQERVTPGAAAYVLQEPRRVTPISIPYSRSSSSSTLPHRLNSQEEHRRLPSPGSNNHSQRLPPMTCIDKANSDEDIDVVDSAETRLSPAPYTTTTTSSSSHSQTPPDTTTTPSSSASPTTTHGEVGSRDRTTSCGSPGGGAAASSSSGGGSSSGGTLEAEAADPNRLRKGRTIYKAQQVYVLEQVFSRTHYPDPEVIETLSRELDISENKIKVWFQNKRARWRRRAAETGLPPQPIGFTLTGAPGMTSSWPPHPTSLPAGVLMPQPVYSASPFAGGPHVAPRPGFTPVGPFPGLTTPPLYLSFDSSMLHAAAKGLSPPSMLPYAGYPMSVLPSHSWGESTKLPGT